MIRNLSYSTQWAIVFCLLGSFGLFLPWRPAGPISPRFAFSVAYGGAIGTILLLTLAYLVATSSFKSTPWWRPVLTACGATSALVVFNVYAYAERLDWPRYAGPWITVVAIVGLLFVAAFELRAGIVRSGR